MEQMNWVEIKSLNAGKESYGTRIEWYLFYKIGDYGGETTVKHLCTLLKAGDL